MLEGFPGKLSLLESLVHSKNERLHFVAMQITVHHPRYISKNVFATESASKPKFRQIPSTTKCT